MTITHLTIKNIGLISDCNVDFANGFTTITGETGAGKSMLIDSLSLALGARADSSLIQRGADNAIVEATFELGTQVRKLTDNYLEEFGISNEDDELILRRTLQLDKSKCFVNGMRATQTQMRQLGEVLVDIHGQNDQQLLLNPAKHSEMLDSFGRLNKSALQDSYKNWKKSFDQLQELINMEQNQEEQRELLQNNFDELEMLNPQLGEEEELSDARNKMMNFERLVQAFGEANKALSADGNIDIAGQLSHASEALLSLGDASGAEISDLAERLQSLSLETSEIIAEVENTGNNLSMNDDELKSVDDRLFALRDCARKHAVIIDELPNTLQEISEKLAQVNDVQGSILKLTKATQELREKFASECQKIAKQRSEVDKKLTLEVEKSLKQLEMPHTRFSASFIDLPDEKWNANGSQQIEFLVATNLGSEMQPLVKVASGGEVSRLMLALKQVFYANLSSRTLVFDEIDTGVGGSVAESMGRAMQQLSQEHQVFSITHLPQVASLGNQHLKIRKEDTKNSSGNEATVTIIENLNDLQRHEEIARMLAGKNITAEAKAAAASLLAG